jgi:hypothetical protein
MNFVDRFSKNTQISNIMNIRLPGADLFHADGRTDMTDMTKPIVAANALKNAWSYAFISLVQFSKHAINYGERATTNLIPVSMSSLLDVLADLNR